VGESLTTKGDLSFGDNLVAFNVFLRDGFVLRNTAVSVLRTELEGFLTPLNEIFTGDFVLSERILLDEGCGELTDLSPLAILKRLL
jgi:hypothetical protein